MVESHTTIPLADCELEILGEAGKFRVSPERALVWEEEVLIIQCVVETALSDFSARVGAEFTVQILNSFLDALRRLPENPRAKVVLECIEGAFRLELMRWREEGEELLIQGELAYPVHGWEGRIRELHYGAHWFGATTRFAFVSLDGCRAKLIQGVNGLLRDLQWLVGKSKGSSS